jgi:hypothetical protein
VIASDRELSRRAAADPEVQSLYGEDLAEDGYVGNGARLWANQPEAVRELFALTSRAYLASGLTFRQCAILVTAAASGRLGTQGRAGPERDHSGRRPGAARPRPAELAQSLPPAVLDAVTWGRPASPLPLRQAPPSAWRRARTQSQSFM